MNKEQIKIFVMTVIVCAFLALIGTSYAYYEIAIVPNNAKESVTISSKYLELKYEDGNGVFSGTMDGYLFPGETFTKTFTVKNEGDGSVEFNIILRDITNTFTRVEDWTYTLKLGDNILIENVVFPSTSSKEVIYNKSIDAQTNEEYTLTVSYANVGSVQQIDWNNDTVIQATIDIEVSE